MKRHLERAWAALDLLGRIGSPWTVRVLHALELDGPLRYSEIQREVVGIPQRNLTLALRTLENAGFLVREQFATFPPRVDYALTERGLALSRRLRELEDWLAGGAWHG